MAYYNLTNASTVNTTSELVVSVNQSLGGLPLAIFSLLLFFSSYVYVSGRGFDNVESIIISSFFIGIVNGLLYLLGAVSEVYVILPVVVLVGMFIFKQSTT